MAKIKDQWEHRSSTMKCETCMWFVPKALIKKGKKGSTLGRCRKNAPTMNGYPAVFDKDWCGSHKLDENKVS